VHVERALTAAERRVLEALLSYGGGPATSQSTRQRLYVVPRLGTISPWASKATDIAKLCALPVRRVERGRVFEIEARAALKDAELKAVAPVLHDRMTETLLTAPPKRELLFAEHEPRSVRTVDVSMAGARP
jgi:phosphoribosylformylglycinamidine synthase